MNTNKNKNTFEHIFFKKLIFFSLTHIPKFERPELCSFSIVDEKRDQSNHFKYFFCFKINQNANV